MSWRGLAHSLFQRQQAIGTQRTTATEWWDRPISTWPVGIHDFPDRQRPLFGGRGNAGGGAGITTPTVMLGTLIGQATELAVQMISFRIIAPDTVTTINPYAFFNAYAHIYTPQNTPDPVAIVPPTFPALNRGFLRPRPRVSDSGRGIILSGQSVAGVVQAQAAAGPRFSVATSIGDALSLQNNAPYPIHRHIYFNPSLIIPAEQFVAVTALNEPSTNGGGLQLDVEFVWREVSP